MKTATEQNFARVVALRAKKEEEETFGRKKKKEKSCNRGATPVFPRERNKRQTEEGNSPETVAVAVRNRLVAPGESGLPNITLKTGLHGAHLRVYKQQAQKRICCRKKR